MASLRARLARTPPGYRFSIGRVLAIYGALMLVLLLASLDQTIVATALPRIVSDLGGLTNYSWVITGYVLATAVTVPLYGKLGDIYGRRRMYLVAIPLFLLGSALCGLAQNMKQLVAFRIVQGLGAGGLFALAQATIAVIVPPRERGRYQGLIGSTFIAGSIAGPALGGLHRRQRELALDLLREHPGRPRRARRDRGRDPKRSPGTSMRSTISARHCSRRERRSCCSGSSGAASSTRGSPSRSSAHSSRRSFPSRRSPSWSGARPSRSCRTTCCERERLRPVSLAIGLSAMAMVGTIAYVPLFVQGVIGTSATSSGAVLTPFFIGAVITSAVSGQWISRTGHYRPNALAGPVLLGAGLFLLSRMDALDDEPPGREEHGHRGGRPRPDDAGVRDRGTERRPRSPDGHGDRARRSSPARSARRSASR